MVFRPIYLNFPPYVYERYFVPGWFKIKKFSYQKIKADQISLMYDLIQNPIFAYYNLNKNKHNLPRMFSVEPNLKRKAQSRETNLQHSKFYSLIAFIPKKNFSKRTYPPITSNA